MLITAVAVAVAAIATVLGLAAVTHQRAHPQPVVIPTVPAPQANSAECQRLMSALPERLGDLARTPPADPAPAGAAAWRGGNGEPVVLRCGLARPADFVVGSPIQIVDAVQWFQVADQGPAGPGRATWFTVDRPVYVALTLPNGGGPTPIQQLSDVIAKTLAAMPIQPGPP